ncbi:MAG: hypothetical protein HY286_11180 [Planctomycetes bacterium]|nr:hypothetical protein [Planctomycetota bacterium]
MNTQAGIPKRKSILVKLTIALLAPAIFLAVVEAALAIAGVRVPRYVGLQGVDDYWIPYNEPGKPAGFDRAFPRNNKIVPEKPPLFLKDKPANGYRIFCLGESTVAGLPFEIGCFSDWLRLRVGAMMPDRVVEVVNAGNAGWYAKEIRELLRESLQYKPDLFIWMVGHNESVPENVLKLRAELNSPFVYKVKSFVQNLRTTQLMSRWIPTIMSHQRVTLFDREASEERPCYSPAELELIQKRYREAYEGAIADARAAGVPIMIATMPKNWRECPPSLSYYADSMYHDENKREQWNTTFKLGNALIERKNWSAALKYYQSVAEIDATPAKLQFAMARACEELHDLDNAKEHYRLALETDGCPMRALSWVETFIREFAARERVPMADFEDIFNKNSKFGIAGYELIADNVHPNLKGHEIMATEFINLMISNLGLPLDKSKDVPVEIGRRRLGIDKYDDKFVKKSECSANLALVLQAGRVDDLWKRTYALAREVLATNDKDWEITAALGVLETMNGNAEIGGALIEKAMTNDGYIRLSYVYYYNYEAPYTRVLKKTKVDFDAFEKNFTTGEKMQYKNRVSRIRPR